MTKSNNAVRYLVHTKSGALLIKFSNDGESLSVFHDEKSIDCEWNGAIARFRFDGDEYVFQTETNNNSEQGANLSINGKEGTLLEMAVDADKGLTLHYNWLVVIIILFLFAVIFLGTAA